VSAFNSFLRRVFSSASFSGRGGAGVSSRGLVLSGGSARRAALQGSCLPKLCYCLRFGLAMCRRRSQDGEDGETRQNSDRGCRVEMGAPWYCSAGAHPDVGAFGGETCWYSCATVYSDLVFRKLFADVAKILMCLR